MKKLTDFIVSGLIVEDGGVDQTAWGGSPMGVCGGAQLAPQSNYDKRAEEEAERLRNLGSEPASAPWKEIETTSRTPSPVRATTVETKPRPSTPAEREIRREQRRDETVKSVAKVLGELSKKIREGDLSTGFQTLDRSDMARLDFATFQMRQDPSIKTRVETELGYERPDLIDTLTDVGFTEKLRSEMDRLSKEAKAKEPKMTWRLGRYRGPSAGYATGEGPEMVGPYAVFEPTPEEAEKREIEKQKEFISGSSMTYGDFKELTGRDYDFKSNTDRNIVINMAGAGKLSPGKYNKDRMSQS